MTSAITESLLQHLLAAFPAGHNYGLAAIQRPPMPDSVAHFLSCHLRLRLNEEVLRLALPQSPWFDTQATTVREAFIQEGHFPADMWEKALQSAISHVWGFLIRPVRTLCLFLYGEEDETVPVSLLEQGVTCFREYPYIGVAARTYAAQRQDRQVDRAGLSAALRAAEQEATDNLDADGWLSLLEPVFALAAVGETGVPVEALIAFFRDKQATAQLDRLLLHRHEESIDTLSRATFRLALSRTIEPVAPVGAPEEPVPLWKQFQQQPGDEDAVAGKHTVSDQAVSRPRWTQFRNDGKHALSSTPPTHADDLARIERAVLGEAGSRYRELFIESLFARSVDTYERVLRRLQDADSWRNASSVITQDVFRAFDINIYSEPAVLFTDAVQARYERRRS